MPAFQHDGISFFYHDSGEGIPFIFQHGLGADSSQPVTLFTPPKGIRLLSFDCRAHGKTVPVGNLSKISIATSSDDLAALMENLGLSRAIIGGVSMGAAIALSFALRYPNRLLGLVLSRPAWLDHPNPWNVKMFLLVARLLREHGPQRGQALFRQTPEYAETMSQYPDVAQSLAAHFERPRACETAVNLERIPLDTPSSDRREWARIKVPTLVLANRHDPIHPFEYGEVSAACIPGAEFKEITPKSANPEQHNHDVQRHLEEFLLRHFLTRPCA